MNHKTLETKLKKLGTKERANVNAYFFKSGKGQYGEGDKFLGVTVPVTRLVIKDFFDMSLTEVQKSLKSPYHEVRLAAVLILVQKYTKVHPSKMEGLEHKKIFDFYVKNATSINNWDLVDSSSGYIVGHYISHYMTHEKRLAFINKMIASKNLWENRIIVLASFYQIKLGNEKLIFYIAPHFFTHTHDLMHKAVGWMLREAGKRTSSKILMKFLDEHAHSMPRTMLRYAIERFPEPTRKKYLFKK